MRSPLFLAFPVLLLACGGAETAPPERPMSAAEHLAEATRCEKQAREHDALYRADEGRVPDSSRCVDPVLDPSISPGTSGGEPLTVRRPCWTSVTNPTAHHRKQADHLREQAASHRQAASELLGAEKRACAGLGENEIAQSPFAHRGDILRVEEYREGGVLRGARVWFRKVPGLTAAFMHRAVTCHQARAAVMGYSMTFQPYDPLVLPTVTASVHEEDDGIVVTLRATRDDMASAALGRAQDCTLDGTKKD